VTGACDLIFQDGFELGNLAPWTLSQTDAGDLTIDAPAKLTATGRGLRAVVDDTTSLFVEDHTPTAEGRYRARFYFDPNGFDPGQALNHFRTRIFLLFQDGAPARRVMALVLKRQGAVYSLAARVRRDDNVQVDTPFVAISDAPHWIEIDWQRSSGANDGRLDLWIDSGAAPVATLTGIDNDTRAVDFVRLGALSVKGAATGTLLFDEFESRRQTFIGP
jgi:hypothetical protein